MDSKLVVEEVRMVEPMEIDVPKKDKKKGSYKRCTKGSRRSKKTNRCNKKCADGFTRSKKSKRCVKE